MAATALSVLKGASLWMALGAALWAQHKLRAKLTAFAASRAKR